jgi:hypothetical protein
MKNSMSRGAGVNPFVPPLAIKVGVHPSGSFEEVLTGADCAVFLVDYDVYQGKSLEMVKDLMASSVVLNGKNLFKGGAGIIYLGMGKGDLHAQ